MASFLKFPVGQEWAGPLFPSSKKGLGARQHTVPQLCYAVPIAEDEILPGSHSKRLSPTQGTGETPQTAPPVSVTKGQPVAWALATPLCFGKSLADVTDSEPFWKVLGK